MSSFQPTSTSAIDKRAAVGGHLKAADKYIREGKVDSAMAEIVKVREIDPSNAYALAFEERIAALKAPPPEKAKAETAPASKSEEKPQAADKTGDKPKSNDAAQAAQSQSASASAAVASTVRSDIETHLEDEYQKKFASEIQKAEQRVNDALAKEEEKHASERAQMLDQLQKERTKYREQLEADFDKRLKDELEKADEQYRKKYEEDRQRAESEISAQIKSEYESKGKELALSLEKERNALALKEQESISSMKKDFEKDFNARLNTELDKMKASSKHHEEETAVEREQAVRAELQRNLRRASAMSAHRSKRGSTLSNYSLKTRQKSSRNRWLPKATACWRRNWMRFGRLRRRSMKSSALPCRNLSKKI